MAFTQEFLEMLCYLFSKVNKEVILIYFVRLTVTGVFRVTSFIFLAFEILKFVINFYIVVFLFVLSLNCFIY